TSSIPIASNSKRFGVSDETTVALAMNFWRNLRQWLCWSTRQTSSSKKKENWRRKPHKHSGENLSSSEAGQKARSIRLSRRWSNEALGGSRYGRKHISITAVIRSRRWPGATRFLRSTQIDWLWNQVA